MQRTSSPPAWMVARTCTPPKRQRSPLPKGPPKRARLSRDDQYDERNEDGTFRCNRRGTPLCARFQTGQCTGAQCRDRKAHQCNICLNPSHGAADHGKGPPARQPKGGKGGKGGKNGKGGKGGKYQ